MTLTHCDLAISLGALRLPGPILTEDALAAAIRQAPSAPQIVTLHPGAQGLADMARVAEAAGATAVMLAESATRPQALRAVQDIAKVVSIPVVGCGDIAALADLLPFFAVGAKAVRLATIRVMPETAARLDRELAVWVMAQGRRCLEDVLVALA